ncbi:MAG TPA: YetF domain-containing protein [Mycobacteriales bacterium]
MDHDLFVMQISIAEKVVRTVLVYAVIVILFRLTGKRGLAGFTTFDFAVVFLLSNVVQNAIIGNDNSFLGGAIGAVTLVAVNTALSRAIGRSAVLSRILEGRSTTVIAEGRLDEPRLRRVGLGRAELEQAVRLQNGDSIDQVQTALLEPGGRLLLTLKPDEQSMTKGDLALLLRRLDDLETLLRR